MITNFKETNVKDTGVILKSTFEQIKMLHTQDSVKAGELAISAIELVLTGEISSDDFMIQLILKDLEVIAERNNSKYEKKVENKKQKRIEENKLAEIAELHKQGLKQKQIGERLGITQQKVSYWLGVIRSEYPELLETEEANNFTENTEITENTTNDNVNVNDNVNDNDNTNSFAAKAAHCSPASAGSLSAANAASTNKRESKEFIF